jgi:hypothetical protein
LGFPPLGSPTKTAAALFFRSRAFRTAEENVRRPTMTASRPLTRKAGRFLSSSRNGPKTAELPPPL